jgi:4-hydroxybenzoate polyprenyltransferase
LKRAIVVDLDGTLINTDMLVENFFLFLKTYPFRILQVLFWLFKGKANLKRKLADSILPSAAYLPYNDELISWLRVQKEAGAEIILATASDQRIAQTIADHVGIFDTVIGTNDVNLASHRKQSELVGRFGEKGFEYVGNSNADIAVWKSASQIHVANPNLGVLRKARNIGVVSQLFDNRKSYFRVLIKALRLHQWTKNLLIFVPLLASHRFTESQLIVQGLLAFLSFGACASSVYLLNDLLDLEDDRQHKTKRFRPLAAGTLPIIHAIVLIPALLIFAALIALWKLPLAFSAILLGYYVLTSLYSFALKRVVMIDVVCLALLYTSRVIAGAAAMKLDTTFWILAFCMFIFLSLAFVKRYTELVGARNSGKSGQTAGRGYFPDDLDLLASLGGASGYLSVLVLALYINENANSQLYQSPSWMWAACPLLMYWLSRVWLLAHRGHMNDDPIIFAIRDRTSRWIGVIFLLVFAMASF